MFGALIGLVFFVLWLAILIAVCVGVYKTYTKMGYDNAWWVFIPFLNLVFFIQFIDKPIWWVILFFIPLVGLYPAWLVCEKVATAYGKSTGFAIGLMFLGFILFPMLGFGTDQPQKG